MWENRIRIRIENTNKNPVKRAYTAIFCFYIFGVRDWVNAWELHQVWVLFLLRKEQEEEEEEKLLKWRGIGKGDERTEFILNFKI